MKKIILFLIAMNLYPSLIAQVIIPDITKDYYYGAIGCGSCETTLTGFTQCVIPEAIINQGNRDFESSENWSDDGGVAVQNIVHHGGTASLLGVQFSPIIQPNYFKLDTAFLSVKNDQTGDSVFIDFWILVDDIYSQHYNYGYRILSPFEEESRSLLSNLTWTHVTKTVLSQSWETGILIELYGTASEPYWALNFYLDDVSLKLKRIISSYQKTTTEPVTVKLDDVLLTKTPGTKEYTTAGNYDYTNGVLYIPNSGVVKVTY